MTKPTKSVRPVWSESSLYAKLVAKDPRFLHAHSVYWSDWVDTQVDIWVFAGRICYFAGFVMLR